MSKPTHEGEAMGRDMGLNQIRDGHGQRHVICPHKSHFVWSDYQGWITVILAPDCECPEPPVPELVPCLGGCGAKHVAQCLCEPPE